VDCKQVIIIRKDLGMRRGKEIAQGAHASGMFLYKRLHDRENIVLLTKEELRWLEQGFKKVVGTVDTLEEIMKIHKRAEELGLTSNIIVDEGCTEFNGVHTLTAIAIGPHEQSKFDTLTGREGEFPLRLY
jgi:PTH2 family peptidyl-tRNA hydrolase